MKNNVEIPFSGSDITKMFAHEVVDLLKNNKVSAEELVDAAVERICDVEPSVNAVPTVCVDRARKHAQDIGKMEAGKRGQLQGLPITIKDLTPVAGVTTTYGTTGLSEFVPAKSSSLVRRMEENGGVVVGKSNTPEFGAGGNTFNAVFGSTKNPWDVTRNAGGSSGGAAASLATGEVWLAHGSDFAGSLRTPAAYCGIVGLRPSPGLVPCDANSLGFQTDAVQGPMARSVRDCALFLDTMVGFDRGAPISFKGAAQNYQDVVVRADQKVRVAYTRDFGGFLTVSTEMSALLDAALRQVEKCGAEVVEADPELFDLDETYRTLRGVVWAGSQGRQPDAVQQHFKQTIKDDIRFGNALTIEDVLNAQVNRTKQYWSVCGMLEDFDVIACPVVGVMPGPIDEEYPTQIDGIEQDDYLGWLKPSFLATVTGLPAISVPAGFSSGGMPFAVQLIGQPRGEAALLAAARSFEIAFGGPNKPIDPVSSVKSGS